MNFKWESLPVKNDMQRSILVHVETGRPVMELHLSNHAKYKQNCAVRRKIKRAYEWYSAKVYFDKWRFF